jgi:hypothetical protein
MMRSLTKEIRIAVSDEDIDTVVGLLDQGAPMIIEHFVLATQAKLYNVLELYPRRGWDINTDVELPECCRRNLFRYKSHDLYIT